MGNRQAVEAEDRLIMSLARSAMLISDMTGDQLGLAAKAMSGLTPEQACSESGLEVMRDLDLSSTLLQGVGWVEGNTMICSSFSGRRDNSLGRADYVSATGSLFRLDVPLGLRNRYVVVQTNSSAGVIHKQLALSFVEHVPGSAVLILAWSTGRPILTRGTIPNALVQGQMREGIFRTADRTVAIIRSSRYDTAAVVIIPANRRSDFSRQTTRVMIPIGIASAVAFSILFLRFIRARTSMIAMVRDGLRNQRFVLVYQPIIDLETERIHGVEALLRWDRGRQIPIGPDVFIPIAENAGLIRDLTQRVLVLLAEQAPEIIRLIPEGHIAINFSPSDLQRDEFASELTAWSAASSVSLDRFVVEATERAILDPEKAGAQFRKLRDAGVRIAIDDFGTGYSNLAYLARLQIDYLKIDRLFVQALGTSAATNNVASAIIAIGDQLGVKTVAEGIETIEQADQAKAIGAHFGQGYLYARPLPLAELCHWLDQQKLLEKLRSPAARQV
ncbi:MAG: EAL domain-containing protein [Alphaproteobacteria bacterium]|nr:MAG: EAL domain-containing protein [Alphaproteobacteria bacterium]